MHATKIETKFESVLRAEQSSCSLRHGRIASRNLKMPVEADDEGSLTLQAAQLSRKNHHLILLQVSKMILPEET